MITINKNYNIYDAIFDSLYFKNKKIEFSVVNLVKTFFLVPAFIEIFFRTYKKLSQNLEKLKVIKLILKESKKIIINNTKNTRKIATEAAESNAPPTAPPIIYYLGGAKWLR